MGRGRWAPSTGDELAFSAPLFAFSNSVGKSGPACMPKRGHRSILKASQLCQLHKYLVAENTEEPSV